MFSYHDKLIAIQCISKLQMDCIACYSSVNININERKSTPDKKCSASYYQLYCPFFITKFIDFENAH